MAKQKLRIQAFALYQFRLPAVALDAQAQWAYIITAYEPDLEHCEPDYGTRKSPGNKWYQSAVLSVVAASSLAR